MKLHAWIAVASALVALAWLPVIFRFLQSYRARKNPQSLAICGPIVALLYANISTIWYSQVPQEWLILTVRAAELLAVVHFYAAFRWSKKFRDTRGSSPPQDEGGG